MKTFKVYNFPKNHYNKELFDEFNITEAKYYTYFGNMTNLKKADIKKYLTNIGENKADNIEDITNYILRSIKMIVKKHYKKSGYKHFWLDIRSFIPTDRYKATRWHTDGNYFRTNRKQFKIVSVPKGPSTLFKEPNEETRKKFIEIRKKYYKEQEEKMAKYYKFKPDGSQDYKDEKFQKAWKSTMDELQKKYPKKYKKALSSAKEETIKPNQYVEFKAGLPDVAAIHSEPDITESRLFFSIVMGTKEEIEDAKPRLNPN